MKKEQKSNIERQKECNCQAANNNEHAILCCKIGVQSAGYICPYSIQGVECT